MANSSRKVTRKRIKQVASDLVKKFKGRKRDYIVRINVDNLRSIAVIRVKATSRKEAVELVKGAIELTGEVAPQISLTENKMDEELRDIPAEIDAESAPAEEAVEAEVSEEASSESAE